MLHVNTSSFLHGQLENLLSPTHLGFYSAQTPASYSDTHWWLTIHCQLLCFIVESYRVTCTVLILPVGSTLTFDTGFSCRHFLFVFRLLSDFLPVVFLLPMGMRLESDIIRTYPSCDLCVSATLSFIPSGLFSAAVGSLL
jgi:hypothetical protein